MLFKVLISSIETELDAKPASINTNYYRLPRYKRSQQTLTLKI